VDRPAAVKAVDRPIPWSFEGGNLQVRLKVAAHEDSIVNIEWE